MNANANVSDDVFRSEVRAFLAEKLTPEVKARALSGFQMDKADSLAWQKTLAERGWSVPRSRLERQPALHLRRRVLSGRCAQGERLGRRTGSLSPHIARIAGRPYGAAPGRFARHASADVAHVREAVLTAYAPVLGGAVIAKHPKVLAFFSAALGKLASASSPRTVRRARLEALPLQIDRGEISAKMAISQQAVLANRAGTIESLYQDNVGEATIVAQGMEATP